MHVVPPYLNKMVEKYEKEVLIAKKNELKKLKEYEFAVEYTKLCEEKLKEAKDSAEE